MKRDCDRLKIIFHDITLVKTSFHVMISSQPPTKSSAVTQDSAVAVGLVRWFARGLGSLVPALALHPFNLVRNLLVLLGYVSCHLLRHLDTDFSLYIFFQVDV